MFSIETIKGYAFQDDKTKRLVERLPKKSIAVVSHQDIDIVAAQQLIQCGVKAVINLRTSMSGFFLHHGVETLLNAKIPVFDVVSHLQENLEGKLLSIKENILFHEEKGTWKKLCELSPYCISKVEQLKIEAKSCFSKQFKAFVGNSLYYGEKELDLFVNEVESLSELRQFKGKSVLVVARGGNYAKDLQTIKSIIKSKKLITIAVDGGADGLLKIGVKPDYIIGDMDSVSEKSLKSGANLLVHTYRDGRSPGEGRMKALQLPYKKITFLGTSEDVATIFAYCSGAQKIYTVGTRVGMNEYLEKGRIGMGSSLLTRMKVGHVLVDLKGIHELFAKEKQIASYGWGLIPAVVIISMFTLSQRFGLFASLIFQWWGGG